VREEGKEAGPTTSLWIPPPDFGYDTIHISGFEKWAISPKSSNWCLEGHLTQIAEEVDVPRISVNSLEIV
jgi:hypothetical protein